MYSEVESQAVRYVKKVKKLNDQEHREDTDGHETRRA